MGSSHEVLLRFFYLTSVALVTGVSFWLNRRYARHFFASWPRGYLCLLGMAALDTAGYVLPWREPPFVGLSAAFTLIAYFFVRVGFEVRGQPPPRWLAAAAAALFASSLGLRLVELGDLAITAPVGASALVFVWLAGVFLGESLGRARSLARILAVLLVAKGVSILAYPLFVTTGTEWLGYSLDATLHLLVGTAMLVFVLERSAGELQLLVESNVNHSFFLANPRGEITTWNSGARRLHGFSGAEVVGRPFSVLRDAGASPGDALLDEGSLGGSGCVEHEGWHWRKDGRRFWARVAISPVRDPQRNRQGLAVLVHDLSDRRALEEERTRLSVAVRQSVEGIVVTDAEGRVEYVNPAFERSLGLSAAQALGRPLQGLDLGGATAGLAEAIEKRAEWFGRVVRREDGRRTVVEDLVLSPAKDASGEVNLFVLRLHDVSREIALQEQVHAARKMEEIGRLAGGIAHDFGNVLAVIVSYNHVLKKRAGADSAIQTSVEAIGRATSRADRLIRQLLAFCRQDVKVPQTVELGPFVSQWLGTVRRVVREEVVLRTRLDPEAGCIRVDPEQLEQALMTLVLNARDAMPAGGTIAIETRAPAGGEEGSSPLPAEGPLVELSVSDDGPGMSPETRARIFEPFFTTKPGGKGTGIGLAVVESFVREAGGTVAVESEPGRGTTFRLLFPRVEAEARLRPGAPRREGESAPVTVLVVDDEPLLGQVVQRILEQGGLRTLGATGAAEALELGRRHPGAIDLLLTDVTMPGMSGPALAEAMRSLHPGMKTLFMSGHTEDRVVRRVRESGGGGFIAKPFLPEELLRRVGELAGMDVEGSGHEESEGASGSTQS